MQQNLKEIIVLGVTMLVLGSCGLLLWSCVVELLCLDTNKKGCVEVDLPSVILVFLEAPQIPTCSRILKAIIVLVIIMLVIGSCGCLLWSYVVEKICLDTNEIIWVEIDLPSVILVFFKGPQMPTCSRI